MNLVDYLGLLLTPALLAAGQFLFKRTADSLSADSAFRFISSLLGSPYFWAALSIYGAATLMWVFTLSRVPLSRAMPFVALAFVIVPVISAMFLGERLNSRTGSGWRSSWPACTRRLPRWARAEGGRWRIAGANHGIGGP